MRKLFRSAAVVGCLGITSIAGATIAAQQVGGSPAKGMEPCGVSATHRQDAAQLVRRLEDRSASGRETASGFKRIESKLRAAIVESSDDADRQKLQDLFDDITAARAAADTGSDQQGEAVALLKDRLAAFARKC